MKEFPPAVIRKVVSPETAYRMRRLLEGVVMNGTGKKARTEEYRTGGKTGTAQKVEPNGTYSHDKFVGSFMGFAPVAKPVITVTVCIDEPHPVYYGGDVAAPVFRNVVDESLKYMNAKAVKAGF
jgi:stage V sporulation protein D (sporulation-specific penicillin-binding protein)